MKRLNDEVGDSEKSVVKKGKVLNSLDLLVGACQTIGGEEERVSIENEALDSARPGYFYNENWKKNYDLSSINEEYQKVFCPDLNIPVFERDQGPKLKGPLIIDIPSDDSDVEIISSIDGYKGKCKATVTENLSLGLGISGRYNVVGESSLQGVSERRFTWEEKGKTIAVNSWLSLKPDYPSDLEIKEDNSDIEENVEVRLPEPVAEQEVRWAERELRQAEQEERIQRQRERERRKTATRFARFNNPRESNSPESTDQDQRPVTEEKPVELLGNCPGPFSEVLRRVRERTLKRTAEQLIEWKPNQDRRITANFVPSLLDLSLKSLAKNFEKIASLELIPEVLRTRLTDLLCDMRRIDEHFIKLLVEGCPTEIRIKNCSSLTDEQCHQFLGNCKTKDMRVLQLDLCGQCMLDIAFRDKLARFPNSFSNLAILSLRGACRLSDNGLKELVTSTPSLQSMNLGHCSLLTCDGINFIADSLGSKLIELYLDDCQKINAMLILPAMKKFTYLEVLSVAGIQSVNDQFIGDLIIVCGRSIKDLDLANCLELTDLSLKNIGKNCPGLRSLNISHLHNLTDVGLEYLANGCRSIRKLNLSCCGFSDEAVATFLETAGESLVELLLNHVAKWQDNISTSYALLSVKVGPESALSLAKYSRKLVYLDLSFCRSISNEALGLIVDSCSSLKLLKLFGCRQITSVFLNGHSNPVVRIVGLNMTPILDHLNLLEPGEVFLRYSPLPICTEES